MNRTRRSKKRLAGKDKDAESEMKSEASVPVLGSRDEPPRDNKEQYLFLLELFVHHLTGERLAKLNQMFFVPTCVCFKFLDFRKDNDLVVTPVDPLFEPQAGVADDVEYFHAGRSVMFAIDENTVTNKILDFIIDISVFKRMPEGVKPDVPVGEGQVDLSKHFAALRKELLQCWHKMVPPPKCYEGDVPLMFNQETIGSACIYVRMSAFGHTIVTEFETPRKNAANSYVFKGDELNRKALSYDCRIIDPEVINICRDEEDELFEGRPPCRVCVKEEHPCAPCGHGAGATLKPNVPRREDAVPIGQGGGTYLTDVSGSRSKPETCSDVHKQQGGLIQSSRGTAQPCGKAVVLKVSGLLDTGADKKPTVTVASESDAVGPDNPDPEHDVFVLRIGKKGLVGVGEKSDIQLEMRTPKGPERRPAIRHETREMQTELGRGRRGKKGRKKK